MGFTSESYAKKRKHQCKEYLVRSIKQDTEYKNIIENVKKELLSHYDKYYINDINFDISGIEAKKSTESYLPKDNNGLFRCQGNSRMGRNEPHTGHVREIITYRKQTSPILLYRNDLID